MKVLASIVTFNRLELLERCINNLQTQTREVDDILIINNSSTDGTKEFLIKKKLDHINQKNSGSAGGWFTAINYAISKNYDFIWLMDDDGYPKNNSLELLLNHLNKNYSCLSSVVIDEMHEQKLVFPMPILNKNKLPSLFSFKRKIHNLKDLNNYSDNNKEYNFCHLFNGALLSVNHLKLIGNINTKYFMYGDEVDYFFRLRKVGKVVSIINAFHYHPNVSNRPLSNIKLYYYIKNSIILNHKYFDYIILRSFLNILIGLFRFLKRNNFKSVLSLLLTRKIKYIFLAIYRGFKLKIDIDYEK